MIFSWSYYELKIFYEKRVESYIFACNEMIINVDISMQTFKKKNIYLYSKLA